MDDTRSTDGGSPEGEGTAPVRREGSPLVGGPVTSDLYARGAHLYSTRTSEAFDSVDNATGERILLWTLRYPLALESESAVDFVRRLEHLSRLGGLFPKFRRFGVDARGTAYLAQEYIHGRSLLDQSPTPRTLERTFVEMFQVIAPLHKAGVMLSDLSIDSFTLDERGRVLLWALLGPFESGARQTAILPPPETLQFLAPEQRSVTGAGPAADVYAMGVYGYRLFTGRFLHADKTQGISAEDVTSLSPAPTSVRNDLPIWVDDVLGRCLEPDPEARFPDANAALQVIFDAIQSGMAPGGGGRWSRRTLIVTQNQRDQAIRPKALSKSVTQSYSTVDQTTKEQITAGVTQAVNMFTWMVALVVGVLGAGLMFFYFNKWGSGHGEDECSILTHAEYAPPELKPLIFDVTAEGVTFEKREAALSQIAESKDPIAYAVLLALTKCNAELNLKRTAEKLLVQRIGDQGTIRAASVVGKWFERIEAANQNAADLPVYGLLLRSCDLGRPLESRQQALREAYTQDPEVSLQLAAALSLDEREERFLPILRGFLAEQNPGMSYEGRGAGALIFSRAALSSFFSNELQDMIPRFSDSDLRWILEQFTYSNSPVAVEISKELLRRKALPAFQSVFLKALVDSSRSASADGLQRALLKGALGKLEREDLHQFGRWMSTEAEAVLFASCATAPTPDLALEAFEVLAGRSVESEPGASIVKWVKSQFWDYRKKLVKAIGIIGLVEQASDDDLNYAMAELMPFAPSGTLFRVLVQTEEDRLIRMALERMGEITSGEDLLALLAHKNKGVRMQAVKSLKGRNELSILQGILQAYEREKDDEVRALYREVHWVTLDRDKNTGAAPQPPATQ